MTEDLQQTKQMIEYLKEEKARISAIIDESNKS